MSAKYPLSTFENDMVDFLESATRQLGKPALARVSPCKGWRIWPWVTVGVIVLTCLPLLLADSTTPLPSPSRSPRRPPPRVHLRLAAVPRQLPLTTGCRILTRLQNTLLGSNRRRTAYCMTIRIKKTSSPSLSGILEVPPSQLAASEDEWTEDDGRRVVKPPP